MAGLARLVDWILPLAWLGVIVWASLAPETGAPPAPDSIYHAVGYLVLAWLLRRAWRARGPAGDVLAAAVAVTVGVGLELAQALLPYRTAEVRDVVANMTGVGLAMIVPIRVSWRRGVAR